MIKSELVDRLFKYNPRLYREDVEKAVNAIFYEIGSALERGDRRFGAFTTRIRMARTFRNPLTESLVRVKSKRLPHFKMGRHIRQRLNGGEGAESLTALDND
jgi:integration host factor subunit beta